MNINLLMIIGYSFLMIYMRFHRWSSLGFAFFTASISW